MKMNETGMSGMLSDKGIRGQLQEAFLYGKAELPFDAKQKQIPATINIVKTHLPNLRFPLEWN